MIGSSVQVGICLLRKFRLSLVLLNFQSTLLDRTPDYLMNSDGEPDVDIKPVEGGLFMGRLERRHRHGVFYITYLLIMCTS